jgi:putative ABC transport system substrate-binding protein
LPALEAFRARLNQLSYTEGQNLQLIVRVANGDVRRLSLLAAELAAANVDCIITYASPATLAAKEATAKIPIVTAGVADSAASWFFESLARPGGNVTGFVTLGTEVYSKRLAILKELLPKLSSIGFVTDATLNPNAPFGFRSLREAAAQVGVSAQMAEIATSEFETSLRKALNGGYDAVLVSVDLWRWRQELAAIMASKRIVAFYGSRDYVEAGGLISYGTDYHFLFRRAAEYVDRILQGQSPHDLPAQQAERFELAINMQAARALGLELPPLLLARADVVIE